MRTVLSPAVAVSLLWLLSVAQGESLHLADNGQTSYTIIAGGQDNDVDRMAVAELERFLKDSTGASFQVIPASDPKALSCKKRIVVGNSPVAEHILGKNVIAGLKDQQSLVKTSDDDLILIGGGLHGTLYAVYSFLEKDLGCRWYTAWGDIYVPKNTTLHLPTTNRTDSPSFTFRYMTKYFYPIQPGANLFFYRNRLNNGFAYDGGDGIRDLCPMLGPACHSVFFYICPGEYHPAWEPYRKPPAKNFFKTNPEFFSMDEAGKRVDSLQLCFSNKEMRKVFTRHLLEQLKSAGGRGIVHVSAEDVPGRFCFCPDCVALEKQYQCIGGPLYDYLIEACGEIAKAYPQAYVSTLAYRKEQSESPPAVKKLPDNLIVVFAPIDDNFAATLDHPTNQGTLDNLKKWVSIARNVWVWYYTNPYNPETAPIGNVERMAADVKLLHQIGVSGTFFQHDSGVGCRYNFSELQAWLLLKLFQNPDQELQPLVVEFTDFYYGPAAPMVRSYLAELESLRKQMTTSLPWNPSLAMYRYLSTNNIIRWQKLFDQMEKVAANSPQHLRNAKNLRMTLDIVTLDKWQEVRKPAFENKMTIKLLDDRMKNQLEDELSRMPFMDKQASRDGLENLLAPKRLLASAQIKPVPAPLDKIPSGKIRQTFPLTKLEPDSEAALSVAVKAELLELPLTMGVYDQYNRKFILSATIPADQLKPGKYHIYKIGQTVLTPNCCFWLTQKWFTTISLEQYYVMGDPGKKWDIYVSIKVDGPGYGRAKGGPDKNVISCDRVVLIELPEHSGKASGVGSRASDHKK